MSKMHFTEKEQLSALVVHGVRDYLGMFRHIHGDSDKGGGRRKLEGQNTYDTVVSVLISGDLTSARIERLHSQKFKVSH